MKEIVEKQISSFTKISKFTCTLFKDLDSYKQHGTGVFVKIENKNFLFSAAHVFDDFEKLFIPTKGGKILLKPGGKIIKNNPKKNRETDDLDLGILILDNESVVALLDDYSFLESSSLEINHSTIDFSSYIIFGYPSNWSKYSLSKNSFHSNPFISITKCVKPDEYKKLKRKKYLNIILEYHRNKTLNFASNLISYGPDLFGISGCGLWYINPNYLESEPKLIGIMNEWPVINKKRLIATRIDAYTELLRKNGVIDFQESNLFGLA